MESQQDWSSKARNGRTLFWEPMVSGEPPSVRSSLKVSFNQAMGDQTVHINITGLCCDNTIKRGNYYLPLLLGINRYFSRSNGISSLYGGLFGLLSPNTHSLRSWLKSNKFSRYTRGSRFLILVDRRFTLVTPPTCICFYSVSMVKTA